MDITFERSAALDVSCDCLIVPVASTELAQDAHFAALDTQLQGLLSQLAADEDFKGKPDSSLRVPVQLPNTRWLHLVGIDATKTDEAAAALAQAFSVHSAKRARIALVLPEASVAWTERVALKAALVSYRYERFKSEAKPFKTTTLSLLPPLNESSPVADAELHAAVERARILGECLNLARDLVNEPPNSLVPATLAESCEKSAKRYGLSCEVWGPEELAQDNMRLFLAVAQGSRNAPRLVKLHYSPKGANAKARVALVGKGLTFDAGGLCLKPGNSMLTMKLDMGGAAATLGIALAVARLQLPIELTAYIGCAENMPDGNAYRPGDVYESRSGKFVEIVNTDAEGRLVLADVLDKAAEDKPDLIIDHATLTGACMVALGPLTSGLFTKDDTLASAYLSAAETAGELVWRLPLSETLKPSLKSEVADLKHTGGRLGGASSAALFLDAFVGEVPHIHMDIAGPAFLEKSHDVFASGGTGAGIRTAVAYLQALSSR